MKTEYKIETHYNSGGNHGYGFYHTELVQHERWLFGLIHFEHSLGYWNADTKEELEKNISDIRAQMPDIISKYVSSEGIVSSLSEESS